MAALSRPRIARLVYIQTFCLDINNGQSTPDVAIIWRPAGGGAIQMEMTDMDPVERMPNDYDSEEFLRNGEFLPHILTVANNAYAWHTSKLYLEVLGIGINETRIIAILYEYGELQAWRISDILQMNKATVSQSIKTLEKRELVEIFRRREGRFIRPTKQSVAVHQQIVRMARSREEVLLNGFSLEERKLFIEFLKRFSSNIPKAIHYANKHFMS